MISEDILNIGSSKWTVTDETPELLSSIESNTFMLPNASDPAAFCRANFSMEKGADYNQELKFNKGTTTLAFKFQHGIVVSVDSRATQGPYIASQSVKKVIEINKYLLGTMAGGAADCQYWERHLGTQCALYNLRNNRRITVCAASKLLANVVRQYRNYGLSLGAMIAGWDEGKDGGPELYYVDNDGVRLKHHLFAVGSGATFAYSVLDSGYRYDLTKEEAIELGKKAILHAVHRDAYSGGINNVYFVGPDGWEKVWSCDTHNLHYQYFPVERIEPKNYD